MRSEKRRRRRGLLALLLVLTLVIGILPADRVQADGSEGQKQTISLRGVLQTIVAINTKRERQ